MNTVLAKIEDQMLDQYLNSAYPEYEEEETEYETVYTSIRLMEDHLEYSFESEGNFQLGSDWKADFQDDSEIDVVNEWRVR